MNSIKAKQLSKLGYTNDQARSLALQMLSRHYKHATIEEQPTLLTAIKAAPQNYMTGEATAKLAAAITGYTPPQPFAVYGLLPQPAPCKVYGGKDITAATHRQMELAMQLPVAVQGALMPDAHTGYGLPIGGVLATHNAVIPYAVGVDIGCRMALTITDERDSFFRSNSHRMNTALRELTHFGMEGAPDDPAFQATALLRRLRGKAAKQLGSSGGGNHFAEFGSVALHEGNGLGLPAGKYVGLLTHSGSRGLGANVAQHYTRIATDVCRLPREVQQLAWLDMNSEAGQEYWLGMSLAGAYAAACHECIHHSLLGALGLQVLRVVANHHNYAWQETLADGTPAIVHRKGATPAHEGEWGIIPGSMTTPAYLVTGTGQPQALSSAAHGAGRAMSRQRAKENMTPSAMRQLLDRAGVTLIGGSVEESPMAYKDIDTVLAAQGALVTVQGTFMPAIVKMNKN